MEVCRVRYLRGRRSDHGVVTQVCLMTATDPERLRRNADVILLWNAGKG